MGKVYAIKFQEVNDDYKMVAEQYRHMFTPVADHYYLKYFRYVDGSEFLSVSDEYDGGTDNQVCFSFNKTVKVVGYSADVPLIINVRGRDRAVLMPNYTGTIEMLPTSPSPSWYGYEGRMGSVIAIPNNEILCIKPGV